MEKIQRKGISYSYQNGHCSHFSLKKIEGSCYINKEQTYLVGVRCRICPYYWGTRANYVVCTNEQNVDDEKNEDTQNIITEIYDQIKDSALRALDY